MPSYTLEELSTDGLRPSMELLIAAASEGGLVTYGKLATHLQAELAKPFISPRQIGWVAGPLMDRIQQVDPEAPLINLLVVRGDSEQPGAGADSYLRHRFGVKGRVSGTRRQALVQTGLNEVWTYPSWPQLFERVFAAPPRAVGAAEEVGYDDDGKGDNPKFNAGLPESPEHKALKAYVLAHPELLRLKLQSPIGTTERRLLSGDAMDVEFVDGPRRIGIEVKSRRSGWHDLRRGIYQCVKYRAVLIAQSGFNADDAQCQAILVTEQPLPADLRGLAKRLGVPYRRVTPRP